MADGVLPKVIVPMVLSPLLGFAIAFVLMLGLYALLIRLAGTRGWSRQLGRTPFVNAFFGRAQIVSAAAMGLSHGMNDAQKTMGIVALALAGATAAGKFDALPGWLGFLHIARTADGGFEVPLWVVILCALTMAGGTASGGWRIIMGNADEVAQSPWRSDGSPVVLRGEGKAGCLAKRRGAAGEPSGRHPTAKRSMIWAAPVCAELTCALP
ncbi:MAG TPA: inorganic phosphate transporter [Rhodanobacteraceae bacterium]|nr:inorganic phosphate transporter [Rhodanobacteraceae bacterium]